ncbi:MAG: sulfite exporter TauE/SafE family protein, partial [Nitrospirota bacterium]
DLRSRIIFTLQYNLGRILTYSILGALGGMIGAGIIGSTPFSWAQGLIALLAGGFMIYVGLSLLDILPGKWLLEGEGLLSLPPIKRFFGSISGIVRFGALFEGLIMGLIPCGMVYAVLMKAISSGDPVEGWLSMLSFGLGTMIAMLYIGIISKEIINRRILHISYLLIVVMGIVTLVRGINPLPHHLALDPSTGNLPLSILAWAFSHTFGQENIVMALYGVGLVFGLIGIYLFAKESGIKIKRGRSRYVMINQDLCEGCGDCIAKADCLNLRQVETEYGQKVQVHYPSCSRSYACLAGDCPSFLIIDVPAGVRPKPRRMEGLNIWMTLLKPSLKFPPADEYKVLITGVDSRAVATVNNLLNTAATLEGRSGLYQGAYALSEEGGAAMACCILSKGLVDDPDDYKTDLVLGLDLVAAAAIADSNGFLSIGTIAIVNRGMTPTTSPAAHEIEPSEEKRLQEKIDCLTDSGRNIYLDAGDLAEKLVGDRGMSDLFTLGVAYQAGMLPIEASSLEEAIHQENEAIDERISAFQWGRLYYQEPGRVRKEIKAHHCPQMDPRERAVAKLKEERPSAIPEFEEILSEIEMGERDLQEILFPRIADLILYQDHLYARQYSEFVMRVRKKERKAAKGHLDLTVAVAR